MIGGLYEVSGQTNPLSVLMSTGDGRRTAAGTFWGATVTTINFSSFSASIVFNNDLDAVRSAFELSSYNFGFEQLLDYVDYGEYYTAFN